MTKTQLEWRELASYLLGLGVAIYQIFVLEQPDAIALTFAASLIGIPFLGSKRADDK